MAKEENLGLRLRRIDETRNFLSEEIKHNDLMSENYEKTCKYLNHAEKLLFLVSAVTVFSVFTSLVCAPVGITSSAVGLKICATLQELKSISQL